MSVDSKHPLAIKPARALGGLRPRGRPPHPPAFLCTVQCIAFTWDVNVSAGDAGKKAGRRGQGMDGRQTTLCSHLPTPLPPHARASAGNTATAPGRAGPAGAAAPLSLAAGEETWRGELGWAVFNLLVGLVSQRNKTHIAFSLRTLGISPKTKLLDACLFLERLGTAI